MGWGLTHSIVTIQITQFACIRIVFNRRLNQDNVSYFFLLECLLFLEKYTGQLCPEEKNSAKAGKCRHDLLPYET